MAFTPSLPNAYDTNLIPKEVRNQYFLEVLMENPLRSFMGNTQESVIQVVHKEKGTGPTSTFALARDIDYKQEGFGYDQISGKGQELKFYEDTISVGLRWQADKLQGMQLTQLNTPIDVYGELKPQLIRAHNKSINYNILKSATFGSYAADFTVGPVADRVIYGTDAAYNANMITATDNIGGNTYQNGGLSVAAIENLRDMAVNGGTSYRANKIITPYMMKNKEKAADPYFVYFASTESMKCLKTDPDWKAYAYRGVIESPDQPSRISGAMYKGRIDNVLIYEMPELGDFKLGTDQGFAHNNAWNLFCGAQAFGIIWHGTPWFAQEITNMGTNIEMARLEFRGEKAIKFPSYRAADNNRSIENGIIHHIVRLDA